MVPAALAFVQLALELVAISGADPSSPDTTGALFETVQRTDQESYAPTVQRPAPSWISATVSSQGVNA